MAQGVNAHLDTAAHIAPKQQVDEKYVATVNAEIVAVAAAIQAGAHLAEVTLYCSAEPNWYVYKTIVTLGIRRVVYYGPSKNDRIKDYSTSLGVEVVVVRLMSKNNLYRRLIFA